MGVAGFSDETENEYYKYLDEHSEFEDFLREFGVTNAGHIIYYGDGNFGVGGLSGNIRDASMQSYRNFSFKSKLKDDARGLNEKTVEKLEKVYGKI
jgi:hypothetical protein